MPEAPPEAMAMAVQRSSAARMDQDAIDFFLIAMMSPFQLNRDVLFQWGIHAFAWIILNPPGDPGGSFVYYRIRPTCIPASHQTAGTCRSCPCSARSFPCRS